MKSLIITEKPSVARDIARVLKCNKNINGVLEGTQYVITWALGHLVTLADPEDYDIKYKEWRMEYLPIIPDLFKLEIMKETKKQYNIVKNQIHRKDIGEIIIATDAGREGELVARLILEKANNKKPIKRLWISSITDKAIKEGFAHLKNGHNYDNLYDAAMCRAEADWLVGINATRALTCKYNASLSCGRVQTPTIAMIAKREEEIRKFHPKPYYGITAKGTNLSVSFIWQEKTSKGFRCFEKEIVQTIIKQLQGEKGIVTEIKKTPKKLFAPLLYDLTELQRDANKRFNFSAKETLTIMQRLYENHKVLTYPRTDCRYISTDIVPTLKERLHACNIEPYKKLIRGIINDPISSKASFVNDSKISDHHAIIPTEQFVPFSHMTVEEHKIYDLVVKRFLAVLYPPFEYEQTTISLQIGTQLFLAKGRIIKEQGWKIVYGMEQEEEEETEQEIKGQQLPDLKRGECLFPLTISMTEGKTKPPAPFNEATLLSAMENPIAYMDSTDKEMAKVLDETGGLGTVATRADIIEKLFSNFLLEKRGKDIIVTSKAKQLLELVPQDLKKPELTAHWESQLSKIAKGSLKREVFIRDICSYSQKLIQEIKMGDRKFRHDNLTNRKCPECGKFMLLVKNKTSELLICQDRVCSYRETIARTSNARCPVCHKKMELRGKDEKQIFICKCGYKEKLTAFQERRKKEGGGVSKKDVQNYMQKQKKEINEPLNSPFADAFAKFNLD